MRINWNLLNRFRVYPFQTKPTNSRVRVCVILINLLRPPSASQGSISITLATCSYKRPAILQNLWFLLHTDFFVTNSAEGSADGNRNSGWTPVPSDEILSFVFQLPMDPYRKLFCGWLNCTWMNFTTLKCQARVRTEWRKCPLAY